MHLMLGDMRFDSGQLGDLIAIRRVIVPPQQRPALPTLLRSMHHHRSDGLNRQQQAAMARVSLLSATPTWALCLFAADSLFLLSLILRRRL